MMMGTLLYVSGSCERHSELTEDVTYPFQTDTKGRHSRYDTMGRMRFTTQWRAAFRVKSFSAVVVRGKLSGDGGGGEGGGGGWRLEISGGGATSQTC